MTQATQLSIHELSVKVAMAGLSMQSADGAMPCGVNGPHQHTMTPARNTGHWAILFSFLYSQTLDNKWKEPARRALNLLVSHKLRPLAGSFWHRKQEGFSSYNGLIGQAWSLEALSYAHSILNERSYREAAAEVAQLHPFEKNIGLWREVDLDGSVRGIGMTLNQQIWFTAMASRCISEEQIRPIVKIFLDHLPEHIGIRRFGLLYTPTIFKYKGFRPRVKQYIRKVLCVDKREEIDAGYHAFTLVGMSFLYEYMPNHPFFHSSLFEQILQYAFSDDYQIRLARSRFAYPYNMPGFELPYMWGVFVDRLPKKAIDVALSAFRKQFQDHYSPDKHLFCRNTIDPETLSARYYEIYRIPNTFWKHVKEAIDEKNIVPWYLPQTQ